MKIKLSGRNNKYVQVDKKWYLNIPELSLKWHKSSAGYARRSIYADKKVQTQYMARLIWETIYGPIPENMEVEHKNQNKLDNTRRNLRLATVSENHKNVPKLRGRSIYKGVAYHKRFNKWQSYASLNGKKVFLGYYKYQYQAALAYNRYANKHYGKFKNLNKIPVNLRKEGYVKN